MAKFAKEFDFDIAPLLWTSAFFEKGILMNDEGNVRFVLPFVEHYLLAKALNLDPNLAKKYFQYEVDESISRHSIYIAKWARRKR